MTRRTDRTPRRAWLTWANGITLFRLLLIAPFLYVALALGDEWTAVGLLALGGLSDFLDGFFARRLKQVTAIGTLLDPGVDRVYIVAVFVALAYRDVFPWWFVALPVARDLMLAAMVPVLRNHGVTMLPIHLLGKAATFTLLYAFPLLLLGDLSGLVGTLCRVVGWACAVWGVSLSWWSGVVYVAQTWQVFSTRPRRKAPPFLRSFDAQA